MSLGWIVCMSLWAVFMLLWAYFDPIKRRWFTSIPFAVLAVLCALFSIVFID